MIDGDAVTEIRTSIVSGIASKVSRHLISPPSPNLT